MEEAQDVAVEAAAARSDGKPRWVTFVSVGTLAMAMISAVGILLAGITLNEFFVERTAELMEVSQLGVDRVNIEVLQTRHEVMEALGHPVSEEEIERLRRFEEDARELEAEIDREDAISKEALLEHELFAIGVTLLSIAIALSAVSMIMTNKTPWFVGIAFGGVGGAFIVFAIGRML